MSHSEPDNCWACDNVQFRQRCPRCGKWMEFIHPWMPADPDAQITLWSPYFACDGCDLMIYLTEREAEEFFIMTRLLLRQGQEEPQDEQRSS